MADENLHSRYTGDHNYKRLHDEYEVVYGQFTEVGINHHTQTPLAVTYVNRFGFTYVRPRCILPLCYAAIGMSDKVFTEYCIREAQEASNKFEYYNGRRYNFFDFYDELISIGRTDKIEWVLIPTLCSSN